MPTGSPFFPEQRHGSGSSHRLKDRGRSVVRFQVLAADVVGGGAATPSLSHRPSERCSARLPISRSRCLDPRASPDFFVAILWRACHHVNLPGSARFSLSDVVVVDIAFSPLLSLLTLPYPTVHLHLQKHHHSCLCHCSWSCRFEWCMHATILCMPSTPLYIYCIVHHDSHLLLRYRI